MVVLLRLNPVFKPKATTDSHLFEFHPQFGGFCITAGSYFSIKGRLKSSLVKNIIVSKYCELIDDDA